MFEANNDLERSLVKAATDPSHRPQFYRDLLKSTIFVVNAGQKTMDVRDGVLQKGADIHIQAWQRNSENWLPIFSSLQRLQQSLESEAKYLQLNARDFFEVTRGANVVLNPNLDYGKEFTAPEIESLVDGSIFRPGHGYTVEKETQVLLSQPALYPSELVNGLSRLFARHRSVNAAYLAQIFNPERDEKSHILIGLDTDGNWQTIAADAGMVAVEILPHGEIVDFVRVSPDDSGVSQYMLKETKPFYKKSFLRRLFG